MIEKDGAIDKSKAFAPTYPQFVMRNSNLRSSLESGVRLKESLLEDADISGDGADDHIGLCLSI